jgi:capsular polysaccharide biosynthesis protein
VSGTRLVQRAAERLIRAACRRLPADVRAERCREWTAELPAILDDEGIGPSWLRGLRALAYCAGIARAARQLSRPARAGPRRVRNSRWRTGAPRTRPNDTAVRAAVGLGVYVVVVAGVVVVPGILAGAGYAKLNPPMLTSTALVVLPQNAHSPQAPGTGGPDPYTAAQEVIATSTTVLTDALPHVRPPVSLTELRREIQVGSLTSYVISISAQGAVAADAEATANAVANSYISYIGSKDSPVGRVPANLLQPATSAVGLAPLEALIIDAVIGAISGALIGAVLALAISRADRRDHSADHRS